MGGQRPPQTSTGGARGVEVVVTDVQGSGGRHRHRAVRPPSPTRRKLTRGVTALMSAAAIVATGTGWWVAHGALGGITVSSALGTDDPRSSGGEMNILLIGLDSRKDQDGNDLPSAVLDQLHAGDSDAGGYNTNTLILVHVGEDNRVIAFSIPRDDWVPFSGVPGYRHIKIKEAYGLTKQNVEQKLIDQGVSDQRQLETRGREAGRAATLRAVRNLTGVPIDYFAEVNLAGFYDLTKSLGGVQVCLNHAVYDSYSGANFPAGRQTLNAAQALAFVRQRHGLENGDLDRTHRQQAFLVSVMHKLESSGTFSDLGRLKSLIAMARKDVVLSAGWNEEQFQRMAALAGGDVEFRTLPVVRYDFIDGQDVNIIDPAAIKSEITAAIGDATSTTTPMSATVPPNPLTVVDVINAGSTSGLAAQVSHTLRQYGYTIGVVRDRTAGDPATMAVAYGPGMATDAQNLATVLGIDAPVQQNSAVKAGHIEVVVDDNYSATPQDETSTTTTTTTAKSYYGTTSTEPTPDRGAPIIDSGGVPCVN
jgi:LCP family protein required for cell wall assembly